MEREYPVPGYEKYFATQNGDIISYKGTRKTLKPQSSPKHSARCGGRKKITLSRSGKRKSFNYQRVVLAAKLGRTLEPWEQACHIDGDPTNNAMANLEVGCFVNNAIDCIENGKRQSSAEQIKRAIKRLKELLKTLDM